MTVFVCFALFSFVPYFHSHLSIYSYLSIASFRRVVRAEKTKNKFAESKLLLLHEHETIPFVVGPLRATMTEFEKSHIFLHDYFSESGGDGSFLSAKWLTCVKYLARHNRGAHGNVHCLPAADIRPLEEKCIIIYAQTFILFSTAQMIASEMFSSGVKKNTTQKMSDGSKMENYLLLLSFVI